MREQLLEAVRASVADARVVAAVEAVPREAFVPADHVRLAWVDEPLPIGEDQTISQPSLVARMCAMLELHGHERVLDVGTGSGYAAALLCRLAASVVSVERHAGLSAQAGRNLARAGVKGVELVVGDGTLGHAPGAPYDAIHVAAAAPAVPPALVVQLADGGRLVLPVGRRHQRLVRLRRAGDRVLREDGEPVRFVPLVPRQG